MKSDDPAPPRLATTLLRRFCDPRWLEEIEGDLQEQFAAQARQEGLPKARLVYWRDVLLLSAKPYLRSQREQTYQQARGPFMLKNYAKIALRNLQRHKGYSLINVTGLAVGMACCMVILLYVQDELAYDRFHEKANRVFRVVMDQIAEGGSTDQYAPSFAALGPAMLRELPEVEAVTRTITFNLTLVQAEGKPSYESRFFYADSSVFDLFSYRFLRGDPKTALNRPFTVVLTEATAARYFGDDNPIGLTITVNNSVDFEVTAVLENPPTNTHFPFDFLASLERFNDERPGYLDNQWRVIGGYTYVLLKDGVQADAVTAKLSALTAPHLAPLTALSGTHYAFHLQPLTGIHLRSHRLHEIDANGNPVYIYLLSAIATLILFIACINFVNLATARATQRAREVGVRKVVGAHRLQLVRQFLTESALLAGLALTLAFGLFALCLPLFNNLSGKLLSANLLKNGLIPLGFLGITVLAGFVAGSYPAFVLSSFRPVEVLKGDRGSSGRRGFMRKGLVVAQFAMSTILIVSTLVIDQQLAFMKNARLGFDQEQVVVLRGRFRSRDALEATRMKQDLLRSTEIQRVTLASHWPTQPVVDTSLLRAEGTPEDAAILLARYGIDEDYIATLGLALMAGRTFSPDLASDSAAYLLNEAAVRHFGWAEPLGKRLVGVDGEVWGTVIGVVKDFHTTSFHEDIEPIAFVYNWYRGRQFLINIDGRDIPKALAHIEQTWTLHRPDFPVDYSFLNQEYTALYRAEERLNRIVGLFTLLALFIAGLGLFGLVTYITMQRTKEIGIRKVLGASVSGIVVLLTKDFFKLIALAFIVAVPLAYLAMNRWLEDFAYRIDLSWEIFLMAGLAALGIALLTVSYQSIKAALTDPVKSLRYE